MGTLEDYVLKLLGQPAPQAGPSPERLTHDPALRQFGLTGENARMITGNAEDRRYLRSGLGGQQLYNPIEPQAQPTLRELPAQQAQPAQYVQPANPSWWQKLTMPEGAAQVTPKRKLTPEEELGVTTIGGQMMIINGY